jgi:hypothetical protein
VTRPPVRQITSWEIAEQNAADWMRHWGYRNVSLTSGGNDRGVDVRATKALAQVKFEAKQVGRPQLQNLVGTRGRNHDVELLFFSGAGYSGHAVEYATEMDIALFTYALDGRVSPANRAARHVVERNRTGSWTATGRGDASTLSPIASRRIGATIMILLGLLFIWGFVFGLFKPENRDAGFGTWAAAFVAFVLGILLVRVGWRRMRSTGATVERSTASS